MEDSTGNRIDVAIEAAPSVPATPPGSFCCSHLGCREAFGRILAAADSHHLSMDKRKPVLGGQPGPIKELEKMEVRFWRPRWLVGRSRELHRLCASQRRSGRPPSPAASPAHCAFCSARHSALAATWLRGSPAAAAFSSWSRACSRTGCLAVRSARPCLRRCCRAVRRSVADPGAQSRPRHLVGQRLDCSSCCPCSAGC